MPSARHKSVTVRLPPALHAEVTRTADDLGISRSELVRRGLEAVLPAAGGPWTELAGAGPTRIVVEPGGIDRVVYDRR